MNKVQVIIEYLLMNHNVNQVVVIITTNYSMKTIQYKKEFVTQVQTVDLLMKMVYTIKRIIALVNVYLIVHNMVYTSMIQVMDISVVVVIIIHVIVLAHHLAIRRDLILISVIIKELL